MDCKEKYCPNMIFDSNDVSIGEFKTIDECMNFPIHGIWCINRDEDNLFEKYKKHGFRVLIVCSWNRGDKWRFVLVLKKGNKVSYWDLNDLPMSLVSREYENTLNAQALSIIKENQQYKKMNKKRIRLTESDLHRIIRESVSILLSEISDNYSGHYYTDSNGETNEFWHDDNDIPEWIKLNDTNQDWWDKQNYERERKDYEISDLRRRHDLNNGASARSLKRNPGIAAMSALHPNDTEGGKEWRQTLGMEID